MGGNMLIILAPRNQVRAGTADSAAPPPGRRKPGAIAQSLFLTTRTIEMHLANAYHKLGVSARTGLPRALSIAEEN